MLGQSKTAFQAEIDSAAELVAFWRFNPYYAQQLYAEQPISNHTMWNQLDYRPLEGLVCAVTPFNFTSIEANAIHGSDAPETAAFEIGYFFAGIELV